MRCTAFLLLLLLPIAGRAQPQEKYCNNRFGFCLLYPEGFFDRVDPSDNADGLRFFADEQGIEVSVSGSNNVLQWTPEEIGELEKEVVMEDYGQVESATEKRGDNFFEYRFEVDGAQHLHRIYHRVDEIVFLRIRTQATTDDAAFNRLAEQLVVQFEP